MQAKTLQKGEKPGHPLPAVHPPVRDLEARDQPGGSRKTDINLRAARQSRRSKRTETEDKDQAAL